MDRPTTLGDRLLDLARHENMAAVLQMAERIETEAPQLGIRVEREEQTIYLRYGEDRVEIGHQGPTQRVRYVGEFGSEMGTKPGRPLTVKIPVETIQQIATYLESRLADDESGERDPDPPAQRDPDPPVQRDPDPPAST